MPFFQSISVPWASGRSFCAISNRLLGSMLVMFLRGTLWSVWACAFHIQLAKRTLRTSTNVASHLLSFIKIVPPMCDEMVWLALFTERCLGQPILTTNLAACVCQCAKFDQFLPARSHFGSKRPENFVRIAKFPYAAFGPLFAFHCPLFFTRNNDLECKSSRFAAVDRRSVADKQLHLNGVIHSAGVAQCQELSAKT